MNQYIDNETQDTIDYSIEYAAEISAATAEMGKPATPTGAKLPQALVRAIIDGNVVPLLSIIAKLPPGAVNDRDGELGLTPLHIVALLYAKQRRQHHELEAVRYDTICRLLMLAGANPLARAYLPGDSTPYYPAQFSHGMTPPTLRRRMLREAAEDHVGWQPETSALRSIRQTSRVTKQRLRRADTRREQIKARLAAA